MIVRALDANGDWTFGAGLNNYKRANLAVEQDIQTRLSSFVGNCFFDMGAGINWLSYLSGKDPVGLTLAIKAVLINTPNVLGILQLSFNLGPDRVFSISYQVQTSYSVTGGTFTYDVGGSF